MPLARSTGSTGAKPLSTTLVRRASSHRIILGSLSFTALRKFSISAVVVVARQIRTHLRVLDIASLQNLDHALILVVRAELVLKRRFAGLISNTLCSMPRERQTRC